jgi:fructose-bisphosphate aldolase class 1
VQGLQPFEGHELATGETSTRGLETLANFAAESAKAGARFAKWRAVLRIDESKAYPSKRAVQLNAEQLADYAVVCQAAGLVPIVEPEILIEGPHSAAVFGGVTERVIGATVAQMWQKGVQLEGCLLKPQMVIPVRCCQTPAVWPTVAVELFWTCEVHYAAAAVLLVAVAVAGFLELLLYFCQMLSSLWSGDQRTHACSAASCGHMQRQEQQTLSRLFLACP